MKEKKCLARNWRMKDEVIYVDQWPMDNFCIINFINYNKIETLIKEVKGGGNNASDSDIKTDNT